MSEDSGRKAENEEFLGGSKNKFGFNDIQDPNDQFYRLWGIPFSLDQDKR